MPHTPEHTQKPGIFGGLLNQLFPAGGYGDLIDPAQVRDEQNLALRRAGLSILAGAGPQPRGTRNIGASIAQALDPSPWQQRLTQVAQQAAQIKKYQAQADHEAKVNAIIAKFPVDPNSTPAQQEDRYRQLTAAFQSAGLPDEAAAAAGLIKAIRPEAPVAPPEDSKLRDARLMFGQYLQQTGKYNDIATGYSAIINAEDTAQGDVALIFGFMKLIDPGSTVREGEYAEARQTQGIPERIVTLYNNALTGRRVGREQRLGFIKQAHALVRGHAKALKPIMAEYRRRARAAGLDEGNVVYDYFQSFDHPPTDIPAKADALTPFEGVAPLPPEDEGF